MEPSRSPYSRNSIISIEKNKPKHKSRTLLTTFAGIAIGLSIAVIIIYLLGLGPNSNSSKQATAVVSNTPSPTLTTTTASVSETVSTTPVTTTAITTSTPSGLPDTGIPITANTLSFARKGDQIIFKIQNKIFTKDTVDTESIFYKENKTLNTADLTFYGLVNGPANYKFNETFELSVATNQNTKSFSFSLIWATPSTETFKAYYYNIQNSKTDKVTDYSKLVVPQNNTLVAALAVSDDSRYIAYYKYQCYHCDGGLESTQLIDTTTNVVKKRGTVSYFKWRLNGQYEYKELVEAACPPSQEMGPCYKEAKDLPLKTFQF